jgi:hypothetical protein
MSFAIFEGRRKFIWSVKWNEKLSLILICNKKFIQKRRFWELQAFTMLKLESPRNWNGIGVKNSETQKKYYEYHFEGSLKYTEHRSERKKFKFQSGKVFHLLFFHFFICFILYIFAFCHHSSSTLFTQFHSSSLKLWNEKCTFKPNCNQNGHALLMVYALWFHFL